MGMEIYRALRPIRRVYSPKAVHRSPAWNAGHGLRRWAGAESDVETILPRIAPRLIWATKIAPSLSSWRRSFVSFMGCRFQLESRPDFQGPIRGARFMRSGHGYDLHCF